MTASVPSPSWLRFLWTSERHWLQCGTVQSQWVVYTLFLMWQRGETLSNFVEYLRQLSSWTLRPRALFFLSISSAQPKCRSGILRALGVSSFKLALSPVGSGTQIEYAVMESVVPLVLAASPCWPAGLCSCMGWRVQGIARAHVACGRLWGSPQSAFARLIWFRQSSPRRGWRHKQALSTVCLCLVASAWPRSGILSWAERGSPACSCWRQAVWGYLSR